MKLKIGVTIALLIAILISVPTITFGGTKDNQNIRIEYDIKDRPKILDTKLDYSQYIENQLSYTDFNLTNQEEKWHNLTVEEFNEITKLEGSNQRTYSTVDEYVRQVGSKMASGLYRLERVNDESGALIYNKDEVVFLTKPKAYLTAIDFNNITCKIYKSDIIYCSNKDYTISGSIMASLYVIVIDDTVRSMNLVQCIPEIIENFSNDVLVKLSADSMVDGSINKVVYRIPMYEKAQYIGDQSLPMCNGAILASYLSSYRGSYIQPRSVASALYPVTYDKRNSLPDEIVEKVYPYDGDIAYRDFTGISQYALRDIIKDSDTDITMYTKSQMGYVSGLVGKIKLNRPVILTLIGEGDTKDFKIDNKLINFPTHVIMANGYIDNNIITGFDPMISLSGFDAKPRIWMLHSNTNEHLTTTHIFFEGSDKYRLYSFNDSINSKNSINLKENQQKVLSGSLLDLQNLGKVIEAEYEYNKDRGYNYIEEQRKKYIEDPFLQSMIAVYEDTMEIYGQTEKEEQDPNDSDIIFLHDDFIASTLGITVEQYHKLRSGYAPYSEELVEDSIDRHPLLYTYVVMCTDIENLLTTDNKRFNDFNLSTALIVLDDSNISYNGSMSLRRLFMYRKHDSKQLNPYQKDLYNAANGILNSKYVIINFKDSEHNEVRPVPIYSITRESNAEYGNYYRYELLNYYTSLKFDTKANAQIEVMGLNEKADIRSMTIYKTLTEIPYTKYEYKYDYALALDKSVDSRIRDNTYYSTSMPKLIVIK